MNKKKKKQEQEIRELQESKIYLLGSWAAKRKKRFNLYQGLDEIMSDLSVKYLQAIRSWVEKGPHETTKLSTWVYRNLNWGWIERYQKSLLIRLPEPHHRKDRLDHLETMVSLSEGNFDFPIENDPVDRVQDKEMINLVAQAIESLPDKRIKDVLLLKSTGYTLDEIKKRYGVSRERVRQIYEQGKSMVKNRLEGKVGIRNEQGDKNK
jgi:RNA polymerase sigma factor (sigma-70 family)